VTELAAKQVLSLPVYPALSGKDPSTITRGGTVSMQLKIAVIREEGA